MAIRILTDVFVEMRHAKIARHSNTLFENAKQQEEAAATADEPWMEMINDVKINLGHIKSGLVELRNAQSRTIREMANDFEGEGVDTSEVETISAGISEQFRGCQAIVKRIQDMPSIGGDQSVHAAFRLNAVRQVAGEIGDAMKEFKALQKDYMNKIRSGANPHSGFDDDDRPRGDGIAPTVDMDSGLDNVGFTAAQEYMVSMNENIIRERDQQIEEITRNIEDLATMMKELMTLVIDQGTMIDRIDYNVEQVRYSVEQGLESLKKANKEHQSANLKTCIILLVVIIVALMSLIFFKRLMGPRRYT